MRLVSCLSAVLVAAAFAAPAMAGKPPKPPGPGNSQDASGTPAGHPGTSGNPGEPGKPSSPDTSHNPPGKPDAPGKPGSTGAPEKPTSRVKPGNSSRHKKQSGQGNSATHRPMPRKQPGPGATAAVKAKAYGRWCQNQRESSVAGPRGAQFRLCLTAMAELATGVTSSPWTACRLLSRKPVHGRTLSPFGRCVGSGIRFVYALQTRSRR